MATDESQRLKLPLRASRGGYASAELTEDVTVAADFPVQEGVLTHERPSTYSALAVVAYEKSLC